jgi:hypothetical protein
MIEQVPPEHPDLLPEGQYVAGQRPGRSCGGGVTLDRIPDFIRAAKDPQLFEKG